MQKDTKIKPVSMLNKLVTTPNVIAPDAYPVSLQNLYIPIAEALQLSSQLSFTAELIEGYNNAIPKPIRKLQMSHQLVSKLSKHIGRVIAQINIPDTIKIFLPTKSEKKPEKICNTPQLTA